MSVVGSVGRPLVVIAEPKGFSTAAIEALRTWADVELLEVPVKEIRELLARCDVVWLRLGYRVTAKDLAAPIRCRVIATAVTGIDHIDDEACSCAGIQVVSLRGETEFLETIRATAELTLAITLALIRRVPQAMNAVLRGQWNRDAFQGTELFGKTVGIVGLGRLGSIVATYFKVFGMCVVGFDPFVEFPYTLARRCESLDELMAGSDVVSIHVSYSPATRHLINASSLARAKRGAIIVNTSRGGIIDETALLASLKSGRIAGAALDVLNGEPDFAPDHPLKQYACDHDNLVITPHIGGNTRESFEKTELFLADKIRRRWYELETG